MSKIRTQKSGFSARPLIEGFASSRLPKPLKRASKSSTSMSAARWSDIGVNHSKNGKYDEALVAFNKAIQLDPTRSETYFNLGNLELNNGKADIAAVHYLHAIQLKPTNGYFYLNYGNALRSDGRLNDARNAYLTAKRLAPKLVTAYVNLGNLLIEMSNFGEAIESFRGALDVEHNCVGALIGLGNAYCQLKKFDDAKQSLTTALSIAPSSAEAYCNLANVHLANNEPELAQLCCSRALKIRPDFPEALSNLGLAKKALGDLDGAIASLRKACELRANFTAALANLAVTLRANGQIKEALTIYCASVTSAPNDPVIAYNASLVLLQLGEFAYGWELYEKRWESPNFDSTWIQTSRSTWSGNPTDSRLLVWPEQGIGDEVMFCSLLNHVKALAPHCTVLLDPRLIDIFRNSFPDIDFRSKISGVSESEFDLHIPMGSLPKLFCQSINDFTTIPKNYLKANASLTSNLRGKLRTNNKILCGISWKSSNQKLGKSRSMSLEKLMNLIGNEDTTYINLQYGDTQEDLQNYAGFPWEIIDLPDIDKFNDINTLAALIAACDHVVSIDNSTVHIAGALGVKTTVLLPTDRDWRWTEFREQSLWYPSVTYVN